MGLSTETKQVCSKEAQGYRTAVFNGKNIKLKKLYTFVNYMRGKWTFILNHIMVLKHAKILRPQKQCENKIEEATMLLLS